MTTANRNKPEQTGTNRNKRMKPDETGLNRMFQNALFIGVFVTNRMKPDETGLNRIKADFL